MWEAGITKDDNKLKADMRLGENLQNKTEEKENMVRKKNIYLKCRFLNVGF